MVERVCDLISIILTWGKILNLVWQALVLEKKSWH